MSTLITGATGFVGRHLLQALVRRGQRLRCLVRPTSRLGSLTENREIELVEGDIVDPRTLKGVADGIDCAYHLAAEGHVSDASREAYRRNAAVNVEGTRNLLRECADAGVKKVVHFSSTAAMGLIKKVLVDETDTPQPRTPYQRSKLDSERAALSFWRERGLSVVILRPCMIYGPGTRAGEFVKMCRLMKRGLFPRVGLGRNLTPIVHVRDVVQAALAARERGRAGEVYLVASQRSYELARLRGHVLAAYGVRRPYWYLPTWAMYAASWLAQNVALILHKPPIVTTRNVASTVWDREFSIEKARRELGYEPEMDIAEGIDETVRWLEGELEAARRAR